jgi:branched-chain amino acid transport system ATP-binding protein
VRTGIALVPEGRRLFPDLTVEENLSLAGAVGRAGPWNIETVIGAFPVLEKLRKKRAKTLSGGEQQATAIGRALMTNPKVLLVDEVSLGLSPVAIEGVYRSLETLIGGGSTIVLVEQNLARARAVATRLICMLEGRIVLEGSAESLGSQEITEAYFGIGQHTRQEGATP